MYLKEIEIQGFKSFADKTRVIFDQGVTAVVGPNGSGKSNITGFCAHIFMGSNTIRKQTIKFLNIIIKH